MPAFKRSSHFDDTTENGHPKRNTDYDDRQPRKRPRSQADHTSLDETSFRNRSTSPDRKRVNNFGRSREYNPHRRHGQVDSYRPRHLPASHSSERKAHNETIHMDDAGQTKRNHKSKRDRKENPSSRIHSLRKLIERRTLPPPVQVEKERELSALLFEREKTNLRKTSKRNLERYHFVRFMERQKAQRMIKKLQKLEQGGVVKDDHSKKRIEEMLREAEIDLNYTLYAPLGEKYISIFAEQNKHGQHISKAEKYKGNWKLMKPTERKYLTPEQMDELQKESMEAADVLEIFGNIPVQNNEAPNSSSSSSSSNKLQEIPTESNKVKPPAWYEVKNAMEQENPQTKLESLRDRQRGPDKQQSIRLGIASNHHYQNNARENMDWLNDDGQIDPADLDSDSDSNNEAEKGDDVEMIGDTNSRRYGRKTHDTFRELGPGNDNKDDEEDEDEEMSDGDGGFFEKR